MTTAPTPEQLKKLPKWANDHITWLRRELDRVNKAAENMTGAAETPIEVDPYRDSLHTAAPTRRMFLPERVSVRYHVGAGTIDVSLRKGRLDINATRLGKGSMEIQPGASNAFTVGFGGEETKS